MNGSVEGFDRRRMCSPLTLVKVASLFDIYVDKTVGEAEALIRVVHTFTSCVKLKKEISITAFQENLRFLNI